MLLISFLSILRKVGILILYNETAAFCTRIRGVIGRIFVREGQFFADGFAVRRSFRLEEGESRLLSYIAKGGCGYLFVALEGGRLRVEGEGILTILRKEGAELRPTAITPPSGARLTADGCLVECLPAPSSMIRIGGSVGREIKTATAIAAPTLRLIEGQREKLVEIDAQCAFGRYIAILSVAEGGALLLEDYGDSVLCRGNEVTIVRSYPDLRGRTITTRHLWQGRHFDTTREIACQREPSFRPEDMGRELLEAVIAQDDSMTGLLSPEMANERMIRDYFGEVLWIEEPLSPSSPTAVTAICKREEGVVALTYDFDFNEKGRIDNIRCLDD